MTKTVFYFGTTAFSLKYLVFIKFFTAWYTLATTFKNDVLVPCIEKEHIISDKKVSNITGVQNKMLYRSSLVTYVLALGLFTCIMWIFVNIIVDIVIGTK